MKNPFKHKDIKNILSGTLFGLILVAFLFSTVGCGKKKNSASYNPYGYTNPYYPGGGNYNQYNSISAVGVDYDGRIELVLNFSTINSPMSYYAYGQIIAQGELNLARPINCGFTQLNAGRYPLSTLQAGTVNNGVIQMSLQGAGINIGLYATIIEMNPKLHSSTGYNGLDELNATVSICGQSVYIYGL